MTTAATRKCVALKLSESFFFCLPAAWHERNKSRLITVRIILHGSSSSKVSHVAALEQPERGVSRAFDVYHFLLSFIIPFYRLIVNAEPIVRRLLFSVCESAFLSGKEELQNHKYMERFVGVLRNIWRERAKVGERDLHSERQEKICVYRAVGFSKPGVKLLQPGKRGRGRLREWGGGGIIWNL